MLKKTILTSYLIIVFPLLCLAGPSINSASGTFAHKNTITISGSGFGTTGPTVFKWDDFEGVTHTVGNDIGIGNGSIGWNRIYSEITPKISNIDNRTNSTKFVRASFVPGMYRNGFAYVNPTAYTTVYVTWYQRWNMIGSVVSPNWKMAWPLTGSAIGAQGGATVGMCDLGSNATTVYSVNNGTSYAANPWLATATKYNWVRHEVYGVMSTSGVANGTLVWKMQTSENSSFSTLINNVGNIMTLNGSSPWRANGFLEFCEQAANRNYNFDADDIYIASSQARVEIGNNATFSSCTHREIQIPTAWNDTSLSFTINQGSFPNGSTLYLYVVDKDGNVNNSGYPITSSTPDTIAPATPSGISVQIVQ